MKTRHVTLITAIILLIIISMTLTRQQAPTSKIPSPTTNSTLPIETSGSNVNPTLTLTGVMGLRSFPSTFEGPPPAPQDPYVNSSTLVMTQTAGNSTKTYYLYCPTFHSEMLLSSGNGFAAGLTGDEIGDAYTSRLKVQVTGTPLNVTRWGREYDLLNVSTIKILEPIKAPLIVYQSTGDEGLGRVTLPQTLAYGLRGKTQTYMLLLSEGDAVGFRFNSTKPMTIRVLTPDKPFIMGDISPSYEWSRWDDVSSMTSGFMATIRGEYMLEFSSDKPILANVTLDMWRIPVDPHEVFFSQSEANEGPAGGISTMLGSPTILPRTFTVGRTWHGSYWTDHSWTFVADLKSGDTLSYGFNSSEPIILEITNDRGVSLIETGYSVTRKYTIPVDGSYAFSFSINSTNTAVVSFRCRHSQTNKIAVGQPAIMIPDDRLKPSPTLFIPPSIRSTTSLSGILGHMTLPNHVGEFMTINATVMAGHPVYYLEIEQDNLLTAPTNGYTMLGEVSLLDLNEAYLKGLDVQLEGIPYSAQIGNTTIMCFHINSVKVWDRTLLPIHALQDLSVVSGNQSFGWGNSTLTYFPTEFTLGYDYFKDGSGTIYGNVERFFSIRLMERQAIQITVNASSPVLLAIYRDPLDTPMIQDFGLTTSNYLVYESGFKTLSIPFETNAGLITIAMKASSGDQCHVRLDVQWSVTD